MTQFATSLSAMKYVECLADIAAMLQNSKDGDVLEGLQEMKPFVNCSHENQIVQLLRMRYFENLETQLLEMTKIKVAGVLKVLNARGEVGCEELLFDLMRISNPFGLSDLNEVVQS